MKAPAKPPPLPTLRTAQLRLHKLLADGQPCPLCNATFFLRPGVLAGSRAPSRYQRDPRLHAGWHFAKGVEITRLWWGVAAFAGLLSMVEEDEFAEVPQLDHAASGLDLEEADRDAYLSACRFVRGHIDEISQAGFRAYYKKLPMEPLDMHREIWMVEPDLFRLAFDVAKGHPGQHSHKRFHAEYAAEMKAILAASASEPASPH